MISTASQSIALREITQEDDAFVLKLVNQKGWKKFIGDRRVNDLIDAQKYITVIRGKLSPDFGFGYFIFENEQHLPLGIVGILNRHYLEAPDLGYAILEEYGGMGYTKKACLLLLSTFTEAKKPTKIQAIVQANNPISMHFLKSLRFTNLGEKNIDGENLCLFEKTTV